MQKEFLIETRAVADEKGHMLNLKYYLIKEEQPKSVAPLYRICIKKSMAEKPGYLRGRCSGSLFPMRSHLSAC